MAIKLTNISEKVIGIGGLTVLPGETQEVPAAFEASTILEVYKKIGLVTLSGKADKKAEEADKAAENNEEADKAVEKKAKLESLKTASDEDVAALAKELGINPADCKDLADVRKKVKAALSK